MWLFFFLVKGPERKKRPIKGNKSKLKMPLAREKFSQSIVKYEVKPLSIMMMTCLDNNNDKQAYFWSIRKNSKKTMEIMLQTNILEKFW